MRNVLNIKEYNNKLILENMINDSDRKIPEEVLLCYKDWKESYKGNYLVIGGVAMYIYGYERYTEDLDVAFLLETDIPKDVYKFKMTREHGFIHLKTHVEVETVTPKHINTSVERMSIIFKRKILADGVYIPDLISMILLKIGRFNDNDIKDVSFLVGLCRKQNIEFDFSDFELTEIEKSNIELALAL